MARIRTIKPETWTDRRVGECSTNARLLFIATWNFADDHGGLDRSAKQLKAQAFPYDNLDCEPLVQELLNVGLLIEYEVGGEKYLHIKNFRKHQRIDKPQKARIPVYEHSENVPRTLTEESKTIQRSNGLEGNGMERKKSREIGPRTARPSTAIRLPPEFELTPERRAIAETEKADPEREFANFTDHWRSASGAKARKHDWDATWRIWCRRAADFLPRANGKAKPAYVPPKSIEQLEAEELARAQR
jgi:hypothetical protein